MRSVACMPFISGIEMSITTTSGRSSRAFASAAHPSSASPTTSMSGCALTSDFSPSRSITWSSANTIRKVLMRVDLLLRKGRDGYAHARGRAAAGRRVEAERAADERHTLAHAEYSEAVARTRPARNFAGREPSAVVFDDDENVVAPTLDDDAHAPRLRVLEDVRQGFLNDSVDGRLDLGREALPIEAAAVEVYGDAAALRPFLRVVL